MKERKFSNQDIQKAKQISILGYLQAQGFKVARHYTAYALMCSPLRADKTPSFKVDKQKNHWYDFGTDEDGDIIELVKRLENISFLGAVQKLLHESEDSFSFHCPKPSEISDSGNKPRIHKIREEITNQALVDYLKFRKIPLDLANRYLDEVYYYAQGKHYFALGFKNDSGGYEIRNKYFKGSLGKKDITLIHGEKEPRKYVCVFEGFMDFLSLLAYRGLERPSLNVIVLNSLSLVDAGLNLITMHNWAYLYLDYDEAGRKATTKIIQENDGECTDCSPFYEEKGYKDFNECWVNIV